MGNKKTEISKNAGILLTILQILAVIAITGICSIWCWYIHVCKNGLVGVIGIILTIILGISVPLIVFVIKKNKNNNILKQKEHTHIDEKAIQYRVFMWGFFVVISILGVVVSSNSVREKTRNCVEPKDSHATEEQQRQFDELVANYDIRMKDQLTYENACQSINDDYDLLLNILLMLDEHPNLNADKKSFYIEQFKNQADTAIVRINRAVYNSHLEQSLGDEMILKYTPCIDSIEKMRNSL